MLIDWDERFKLQEKRLDEIEKLGFLISDVAKNNRKRIEKLEELHKIRLDGTCMYKES